MAPTIVKNPTYLFMVCALYLVFFSFFMYLMRGYALSFTVSEIINLVIVTALAAIVAAIAVAALGNIEVLGTSSNAGEFVWRGAMFSLAALWFLYFINKIVGMIPGDMPLPITFILIVPPIVGALWGVLNVTVLKSGDG